MSIRAGIRSISCSEHGHQASRVTLRRNQLRPFQPTLEFRYPSTYFSLMVILKTTNSNFFTTSNTSSLHLHLFHCAYFPCHHYTPIGKLTTSPPNYIACSTQKPCHSAMRICYFTVICPNSFQLPMHDSIRLHESISQGTIVFGLAQHFRRAYRKIQPIGLFCKLTPSGQPPHHH